MKTQMKLPSGDARVLARARAFSHQPMQEYCFNVSSDGTVKVFDSVAGHYTSCHAMSKRTMRRICKLVAAEQ